MVLKHIRTKPWIGVNNFHFSPGAVICQIYLVLEVKVF